MVSLSLVQSKRFFWIYCFREKIFGQKTAEEMLLLVFKLNISGTLSNGWKGANNRLEKNMMFFCPKVLEKNNVPLIRRGTLGLGESKRLLVRGGLPPFLPGVYVQEQTPKGE